MSGSARPMRLRDGSDAAIIATGSEVLPSLRAAERLAGEGASVAVYDMHTVKPLDLEAVAAAAGTGRILTVEEHNRTNGLGTAVAEALLEGGFGGVRLRRLDVPDEHVPIGPPAALYAHYRLDVDGVTDELHRLLQASSSRD